MDNNNSCFGKFRCNTCGLILSACLCISTVAHASEHPDLRSVKWQTPDRLTVTSTSTAMPAVSLGFPKEWLRLKPPGK